jgi:hypothetical protein
MITADVIVGNLEYLGSKTLHSILVGSRDEWLDDGTRIRKLYFLPLPEVIVATGPEPSKTRKYYINFPETDNDRNLPGIVSIEYKLIVNDEIYAPVDDLTERISHSILYFPSIDVHIQIYGEYDSWNGSEYSYVRQVFPGLSLVKTWNSSPQSNEEVDKLKQEFNSLLS